MGVTTPLVKGPRPLDATMVAMNAKILRIFYENPFLVKIFADCPPGALRGPSRGGNVARCIAMGVNTPLAKSLPMVAYDIGASCVSFVPERIR